LPPLPPVDPRYPDGYDLIDPGLVPQTFAGAPTQTIQEPAASPAEPPSALDRLIQEHAEAVEAMAEGWAMYGNGGCWDDVRKSLASAIAARIRTTAEVAGKKLTEAAIEEASRAHPDYVKFLDTVKADRAQFIVDEWKAKMLEQRVRAYVAGRI